MMDYEITSATKKLFIAAFMFMGLGLHCQEGSLDTTFNSGGSQPGVVLTPIGINGAIANAVAIQGDGKIIAAGTDTNHFTLARYLTNGSLDTTFNGTGLQVTAIGTSTTSTIKAIAIQPDGKIIAAGTDGSNFVIARYLTNGLLDTSFNSSGTQPGVVVTPIGASMTSVANAVALQVDGKIVVAGTDGVGFVVARYLSTGLLDTTFNSSGTQPGVVTTAIGTGINVIAYAVALQADDKIVAIGTADLNFAAARYLTNGSLDTTFNSSGIQPGVVTTVIPVGSFAFAGAIQANGKILAAGIVVLSEVTGTTNFAIARYLMNGSLDTTFNSSGAQPGVVTTNIGGNANSSRINAVAVQSDGKIIAAGTFTNNTGNNEFVLARYTTDGLLDTTFNSTGSQPGVVITSIEDNAQIFGSAIQADGKIIAAGSASLLSGVNTFAVARYIATPILNATTIIPPMIQPSQPIILSGTAQNESIVTIIIDGVATNFAKTTPLNMSGNESNTTGTWSINIGTLSPGPHTIIASASYKTSNVILLSNPLLVCLSPLSVSIIPSSETICNGSAITLTAEVTGGTGVEFIWSTPGRGTITTTTNILMLSNSTSADTGNYTVVVVDSNGCSSLASNPVLVTVAPVPKVTLIASCDIVSPCDSVAFIATPSGGTPPYQLIWSDGVIENGVTGPITRTIIPTQEISIRVIDANGCSSSARARTILSQAIFEKYCSS